MADNVDTMPDPSELEARDNEALRLDTAAEDDGDPFANLDAKIERAIAENESNRPSAQFTPAMPGIQPNPFKAAPDPGVTHARDLSDEKRRLLADGVTELLPLALRLVKLYMQGHHSQLDTVLTALGYPENLEPGDSFTEDDPFSPGHQRQGIVGQGMVRVHPDRQRVLESLAAVTA